MTVPPDEVALLSTEAQDSDEEILDSERISANDFLWKDLQRCRMCAWIFGLYRKIFPHGYWSEFKELVKISWPIVLTQLAYYSIMLVSLIFCGHLGKESLDGVAIATTVINIVGNCVLIGLSTACDTLFSQTFGSENKHRVGVIMQRAIQILLLACLPCAAVLLNAEHLMLAMGQHPEVARLGGRYSSVFILGLPAVAFNVVLVKYLQAQSIVIPSLLIVFVVNFLNAGFHAMLLYGVKMDVTGAALSVCLSNWSIVFLHIAFIYCSGVYKTTWKGLTRESLCDWRSFMVLALPGLVMITLEWSSFEVLTFLIGLLSMSEMAAHSIVVNMAEIVYTVPLGVSTAAGMRVGNHLGAYKPQMALTSSRVSISIAWIAGLTIGVFLLSTKNFLPRVYTNDSEVISLASSLIPQLALFSLFDFTQGTLSVVLRGAGHQKFGAITNLVAYYVIALPVAIPLTFKTYLRVAGAWWGVTVSTLFQSVVYMIKIWTLNWKQEAEKAQLRAGVNKTIELEVSAEMGIIAAENGNEKSSEHQKAQSAKENYTTEASIISFNDNENLVSTESSKDLVSTESSKDLVSTESSKDLVSTESSKDLVSTESPKEDLISTSPNRNYTSIYISRCAILVFLFVILIIGVIIRIYLDSKVQIGTNPDCLPVNWTDFNKTRIEEGNSFNHCQS